MQPLRQRVIVVGAGIGGLAAAIELGRRGVEVVLLERAKHVGGKMRQIEVGGRSIDAGPTVLTMRAIFEGLFERAGARLEDHVTLRPMSVLARHAWQDGSRLDLFADVDATAAAIGDFASAADVRGYRKFCEHTAQIWKKVQGPFVHSRRPTLPSLVGSLGLRGMRGILEVDWHRSMWRALGEFFQDPRLRQLFGRYATYYGSSPFEAPATLNLIAHVEQSGVWTVDGGMFALAQAMAGLAGRCGVTIRCEAEVEAISARAGRVSGVRLRGGEQIAADVVIVTADAWALAGGLFGAEAAKAVKAPPTSQRSLSALTWSMVARTRGFPLTRHCVFFSRDYAAEFDDLFGRGRLPGEPTVYVCAQDRGGDAAGEGVSEGAEERLFCLVNAPARGGAGAFPRAEIERCERATFGLLQRCGLEITQSEQATARTTPDDFARLFPATAGAIYGAATHSWSSSLARTGSTTRLPGLLLAGGSVHPGAGVPMVTLSGCFAAESAAEALASTRRSPTGGTRGGTSTRSATTDASG
ncbi:MAG: phytoene desaturase [Nannocystis sp.]|nr:phytoene desaturase [Nannocystis sp.]